ncbi:MAG: nucleoside hydrolase [Tumebacillaceae bacterium]
MRRKVLFFLDGGVDDLIALTYALLHEQLEIVGVVAGYGNMPRPISTRNLRYVLHSFGRDDVPVFGGADKPMTAEAPQFYPEVHGPQGMGYVMPEMPPQTVENFADALQLVTRYAGELTIVDTGRQTALATAFLLYGDLLRNVRAYYVMGGAFLVPGNVTPLAEANFQADPIASNLVMRYANPMTLFPMNVTMKSVLTHEMVNYIDARGRAPLVKPMFDFYAKFYQKTNPGLNGAPIHDLFPISAVVYDDMYQYVTKPVQVDVSKGPTAGLTIADFRSDADNTGIENKTPHRIAMDVDYQAFFRDFMTTMTGERF